MNTMPTSISTACYCRKMVVAHAEKVEIGVTNWLTTAVDAKVRHIDGEMEFASVGNRESGVAESSVTSAGRDSSRCRARGNASFPLAYNSGAYSKRRPWFVWFRMLINSSFSFEFVHDPLVESPSYSPGVEMGRNHWEIYGMGIFYTRTNHNPQESTEQQAKAEAATQVPTLLCTWDEASAPPHDCIRPVQYKKHNPLHPCSAYSGSSNPAWISVSNGLAKPVQVTVKKGDETSSIKLDVSKGTTEYPSYSNRILSRSHEDYGKHRWTMVVRVQGGDGPLSSFDVTLIKPMETESQAHKREEGAWHGWVLLVREWGIFFVHNYKKRHVCSLKEEDTTAAIPHCRRPGHAFVL